MVNYNLTDSKPCTCRAFYKPVPTESKYKIKYAGPVLNSLT